MSKSGVVLKLPTGSPAPSGYTFVRSLRGKNIYFKKDTVPESAIDDLADLFGKMGLPQETKQVILQQTEVAKVDDLNSIIGRIQKMNVGGATRKQYKRSKTSRRNRKATKKSSRRH